MVSILQRYVFRELFKVFGLSAVAFTLILSLGSVLRPVQEYGASPVQVIILLFCFLPITLTFVLPIASIFAAALVYGRFASDNELDACRASGVSLLTLVYPGMVLAVVVSITTLSLSFHIMPQFVHLAEKVIKADARQICFRNIQRQGFYTLPGKRYRIYADYADTAAEQLGGVSIVESRKGKFRRTIEADRAMIKFTPHEQFNELSIVATDVYDTDPQGEQVFFKKLPITYRFASLLGDNIKFKKLGQIKRIQNNPLTFYPVRQRVDRTYSRLVMELISQDINFAINSKETDSYYKGFSSDEKQTVFTCRGCSVKDNDKLEIFGDVKFIEYDPLSGDEIDNWQTNRAMIQMENENDTTVFAATLFDAIRKRDDGELELRFRPYFRGLKLPAAIAGVLPEDKLAAVKSLLADKGKSIGLEKPSAELMKLARGVNKKIMKTKAAISAELNTRLVFGLGCISLIMISIAMGIIFKGGHLLTAFGISVIPAGFLGVAIMAGKNITKNLSSHSGITGIAIMWAALVILTVFTIVQYRKLLKI